MPTKKKPTDSTMRNVRAANKRIKALELKVDWLESLAKSQGYYVYADIVKNSFKKKTNPARKKGGL